MKNNKLIMSLVFSILLLLLNSCDCLQHIQGVVVDSESKIPIANSKIIRYSKKDTINLSEYTILTDTNGVFDYTGMAGGLLRCPKLKILVKKTGYNELLKEYKSCCTDNDTIVLYKKE